MLSNKSRIPVGGSGSYCFLTNSHEKYKTATREARTYFAHEYKLYCAAGAYVRVNIQANCDLSAGFPSGAVSAQDFALLVGRVNGKAQIKKSLALFFQ